MPLTIRSSFARFALAAAALGVSACDTSSESRNEEYAFGDEAPGTVAACVERFSKGGEVWSGQSVGASFVYDIAALEGDGAATLLGRDPAAGGAHTVTAFQGGDVAGAVEKFLKSAPKGDSELLIADDTNLLRVNDGAKSTFEEAVRLGCERLQDGVTIRQVTFSQG